MMYVNKPTFIIKKNLQKSKTTGVYFSDVVTPDVLKDVCHKITGLTDFDYKYVENDYQDDFLEATYNKGRLAILLYHDEVSYISFSEKSIGGRNSSVQSVPTAFNLFYSNIYPKKNLYYYFLNFDGNAETDYQILIYRLMNTIGFKFLNSTSSLSTISPGFTTIEDIMFNRRVNAGRNQSNNSTYITKGEHGQIEIYGKTYGANKYETSLICYALAELWKAGQTITLYEMLEGDLKELPQSSLDVIHSMGIVNVVPTDMTLEKKVFDENNSLRSPRYIYNLLGKLGNKHCALCGCEVPEIIQGAHVWPVANIKKHPTMTYEEKLECAIDGDNGLWLCENHHKLFDENFYSFSDNGKISYRNGISKQSVDFLNTITTIETLPDNIMTDKFLEYLWLRRKAV